PYFFLQAAREQGFLAGALPLRPEGLRHLRLAWHLAQAARGARPGGFQYTEAFLRRLFATARLCHDQPLEIISHFPLLPPQPWPPTSRGSAYPAATLQQDSVDYGRAGRVAAAVRAAALRRGRAHSRAAERGVCRSRSASASVVAHYGIRCSKVNVVLP